MTVTVANNYNMRKQKLINPSLHKTKQSKRTKINDDQTIISSSIPIAPMSPQLPNVCLFPQQQSSYESRHSSRRLQRTSIATTTTTTTGIHHHRPRQRNADSSTANSSSTSPINLSRSTSPAVSIPNFIHPISPPCIQVKEPLSPKFSRASSTIMTHHRHCSPPITNNINASTASARTTLLIDDSSGYDSNDNNRNNIKTVSNVPENCFEPETYRNLYPFNSNQQKKLSFSDPTLNQTTKISHRLQQKQIVTNSTTTDEYFSVSSLHQQISNEDKHIQSDDDDDDEIENLSSYEETLIKEKPTKINQSRKISRKYSSPRHRIMTCTSGMNDSSIKLSPSSDIEQIDNENETSFYIMQNRPP